MLHNQNYYFLYTKQEICEWCLYRDTPADHHNKRKIHVFFLKTGSRECIPQYNIPLESLVQYTCITWSNLNLIVVEKKCDKNVVYYDCIRKNHVFPQIENIYFKSYEYS